MGGGTVNLVLLASFASGLSPRGRGNHTRSQTTPVARRSIPAWAGEPTMASIFACRAWVYPRVGGGTFIDRMRRISWLTGSIPAWAGEPYGPASMAGVYPRVGGGTLESPFVDSPSAGLSPRGRGNRLASTYGPALAGSIPAWAGEPISIPIYVCVNEVYWKSRCRQGVKTVYPRVGGGTIREARGTIAALGGLSPRGRGNHAHIRV